MYKLFIFFVLFSSMAATAQVDFTGFISETGGVVLAHSPKSTKKFVGSPSICILPDGVYVASHDLFGLWDDKKTGPVTKVYRSTDKGKTWEYTADFINFPGGCKKFSIRYDPKSKKYWTVSNYVPEQFKGGNVERTRNTQAISWSTDLMNWHVHRIVLQHPDVDKHGFQYLDWHFDGNDIIALSRTAYDDGMGGADNQHNANMITFHRFKNFRR